MLRFLGFLVVLAAAWWVFTDARKRGLPTGKAAAWAIGTLLVLIVVLPLYLIMRPKEEVLPPSRDRLTGPGAGGG
jgi:hypothetical protein